MATTCSRHRICIDRTAPRFFIRRRDDVQMTTLVRAPSCTRPPRPRARFKRPRPRRACGAFTAAPPRGRRTGSGGPRCRRTRRPRRWRYSSRTTA
jgi:hypothetical protein